MPCYEIRTVSVEFKIGNIELLTKALNKINFMVSKPINNDIINIYDLSNRGGSFTIDIKKSQLSSRYENEKTISNLVNIIKRSYSEVVLEEISKKQKWILKKQTDRKFQLQRF